MSAVAVALFELALIWGAATERNVCFDEIGCLNMSPPWISRFRQLPVPFPPKKLPITTDFFSRENRDGLFRVDLTRAPIKSSRPTVIITHDHDEDGNSLWMRSLKDAYLNRVDANVVVMDWGSGTVGFRYEQASANIRVMGKLMAKILRKTAAKHGLAMKDVHLIGEGLGAHLMGYVAKDSPGTGRITGLDPSREYFEFQDAEVRLDKTDANFVDVVHTSSRFPLYNGGSGLDQPIGHVDFYVNIGEYQPGCGPFIYISPNQTSPPLWLNWSDNTRADDCNHKRVRDYFLQAVWLINNCTFWGHKGNIDGLVGNILTIRPTENLGDGKPTLCNPQTCTPLGLKTVERPARGVFFVKTRRTSPYCNLERVVSIPRPKKIFRGMVNAISSNLSNRTKQVKEMFFRDNHISTTITYSCATLSNNILTYTTGGRLSIITFIIRC